MTDTEQKALALVNDALRTLERQIDTERLSHKVALVAIEAHEADKKAFSDAARKALSEALRTGTNAHARAVLIGDILSPFILPEPEPDPLVEGLCAAISDMGQGDFVSHETLGKALAARGYKIERIEQ